MSLRVFLWIFLLAAASTSGVVGGRWYERQQSLDPVESESVGQSDSRRVHALGRLEPHTRIVEVGGQLPARV